MGPAGDESLKNQFELRRFRIMFIKAHINVPQLSSGPSESIHTSPLKLTCLIHKIKFVNQAGYDVEDHQKSEEK